MPNTSRHIRSVVIVSNPEKRHAVNERPRLTSWLKKRGVAVLPPARLAEADAALTLGGDGTILSVAPAAAKAGVPVLGINTGRLGFMTATDLKHAYTSLTQWLNGKWVVSSRMMLEVHAPRMAMPLLALNDAVVRTGSTTRVTHIHASVDGANLGNFIGDGVIASSPTGSTAYSLSAQGPVVHPELDAIILTPICPHSLTQRPVVFPATMPLTLSLGDTRPGNKVQLSLDGQRVFDVRPGETVRIRGSQYKLQLLQSPARTYFGVLKDKLSWGER
jgi:NAD+ kinase